MKLPLTLIAVSALGLGASACGGAGAGPKTDSGSRTSNAFAAHGNAYGGEGNVTAKGFDSDDAPIRFFGHEASAAERQAIAALLRRYYALATRGDGRKACGLMHPLIVEHIPEEYEEQPAGYGHTCATVMSKLFQMRHARLVLDSSTLVLTGVRAEGDRALVLVRFAGEPVPDHIAVHREGSSWKIWELFAEQMP
jgi:hypothetical protein